MKVSRSTSKPRRMHRGSGGAFFAIAAVLGLALVGGFFAFRSGKFDGPKTQQSDRGARASIGPSTPAPAPQPLRGSEPATPAGAAPGTPVVPATPVATPRFHREFEDAIARGAFRDAAAALAGAGGAADAERRLDLAMESARARIAARFDEIARSAGVRAARVYVTHQLEQFPDQASARHALQALLATADDRPSGDAVARVDSQPTRPRGGGAEAVEPPPQSGADQVAPGADLVAMKDEAVRVLDSGEIKAALSILREVAAAADVRRDRATHSEAQRLVRQGEAELRLRTAIVEKVAAGPPEKLVPHLPGEKGRILGASEDGVTFSSTQGQVMLKWRVLPVHALVAMIQILELPPPSLVDAGAALYRVGKTPEADAFLAKAAATASDHKAAIDQVLADARGMAVPAGGFRHVDGQWMSPQEFARHETTRQIAESTKDLAAADPKIRRDAFSRMVKLGDVAKSALNRALLLRRVEIKEDLQKAPVYAKLSDLGSRRAEVDEARAHALLLIEDEVKYPYPYRPPEATAEQFKAYQESQREIDVRVAKLRGLWDKPHAVAVPKPFREKVALLVEVAAFLSELGAAPPDGDPGFIMFLPAADEVTLQTVATSEADRTRIDESAEVMKTNATRAGKATKGELDQARITNEYRLMFGRAAVLVHDQLTQAAHGHCEDMARLGFFAHDSPVPGKTTPYDRIRATGMKPIGASENIAQASGPSGAHEGWCHSSGHHRNLLAAGWKLIGVGNSGHLWCQNFAAGEEKPVEETDQGQ